MKKLSIEIPTCSQDIFEKFYQTTFTNLSNIKDIICVNILFQTYSDEDMKKYISYIESLGIEVHYSTAEKTEGFSWIDLREAVHNIYNECPYVMLFDDDILIKDNVYCDCVRQMIEMMERDPTIGVGTFRRPKYGMIDEHVGIDNTIKNPFTNGGIILRITRDDNHIHDPKYKGLKGTMEDVFSIYEKMIDRYKRVTSWLDDTHYEHYEIRDKMNRPAGGKGMVGINVNKNYYL